MNEICQTPVPPLTPVAKIYAGLSVVTFFVTLCSFVVAISCLSPTIMSAVAEVATSLSIVVFPLVVMVYDDPSSRHHQAVQLPQYFSLMAGIVLALSAVLLALGASLSKLKIRMAYYECDPRLRPFLFLNILTILGILICV